MASENPQATLSCWFHNSRSYISSQKRNKDLQQEARKSETSGSEPKLK